MRFFTLAALVSMSVAIKLREEAGDVVEAAVEQKDAKFEEWGDDAEDALKEAKKEAKKEQKKEKKEEDLEERSDKGSDWEEGDKPSD